MRDSKTILENMKRIDNTIETLRNNISENMAYREELLKEFNKAEEWEKEQQAKSVFIANEQGLKEVSKYL